MLRRTLLPVLLCAVVAAVPARAQGEDAQPASDPSEAPEEVETGYGITGFPILFYTPETSFGLGGAGVLTYRPEQSSKWDRPQSLTLSAAYTARKQTVLILDPDVYFDQQRYQLRSTLSFLHFPNEFYGIGRDTSEDEKEDYTLLQLSAETRFMRKVIGHARVGVVQGTRWFEVRSPSEGGQLERRDVAGADGGWAVGLGPVVDWDGRDSNFYPTRGGWYRAEAAFYRSALGSSYDFERYVIDLRQYVPLGRSFVLAFHALGQHVRGDAPFNELSRNMIRGIFAGRFRDRTAVTAQTELRYPLFGRFSGVAFAAMGDVAPSIDTVSFADPKWGAGAGIRFALLAKEKLNLRLDVAYSPWGIEPYFQLREAF